MRLALILPGFSEHETHWAIPVLQHLVRELARDHDVHIFALRYPHRRDTYAVSGAVVHAFGGADAGGLSRGPLLARALAGVLAEGRRQPFDIIHGLWADEPGFVAVLAGRLLRRPAVVSILGGELVGFPDIAYGGQLSRVGRRLSGWALPRSAAVTVGSNSLAGLAQKFVPGERLQVLPLGVDANLFGPKAPESLPAFSLAGAPAILHVASLSPIKDQSTLLRAFAQIARLYPQAHLHIVGEGPLRQSLQNLARQLGIDHAVTFHGAVSHTALPAYYGVADLFVLSSRFESQSLVVLEAASCGCLPVGTAVGLLPDLLPTDLLAPPGDAEALAQVMLRALAEPRRHRELAESLRRRVQAAYSLDQTIQNLLAIYNQPGAR